jgi:pyruvate/2-oxoglutarate/acetoin dehydrogenase E1 component
MRRMSFAQSIESALAQAMAEDERIIIIGEDVQMIRVNLFSRFGKKRVLNTPISESAFVGAAVSAAMSGLKPVVEIMLVDFIGVAMDAILNHAAKVKKFSGGDWSVPLVIRTACGGGYGDGGQHEQSLWAWLAHIPGISVLVPSTPANAGGLMLAAIESEDPVVYFEHKLLSDYWLDYMGGSSRKTVKFDIPLEGAHGPVPKRWEAIPLGQAKALRNGKDITIISVGVGVHRSMEAAEILQKKGIDTTVLDLRSVSPLDKETVCASVAQTGRLLVVDEDYKDFGLSGELAAIVKEAGISFEFARVCTDGTIPYARSLEDQMLPNSEKIINSALRLMDGINSR